MRPNRFPSFIHNIHFTRRDEMLLVGDLSLEGMNQARTWTIRMMQKVYDDIMRAKNSGNTYCGSNV